MPIVKVGHVWATWQSDFASLPFPEFVLKLKSRFVTTYPGDFQAGAVINGSTIVVILKKLVLSGNAWVEDGNGVEITITVS